MFDYTSLDDMPGGNLVRPPPGKKHQMEVGVSRRWVLRRIGQASISRADPSLTTTRRNEAREVVQ
ncbi:MAG: hypothetical protein OXF41_19690 [bacterium]|nr:hypothetical protein [bacterium]